MQANQVAQTILYNGFTAGQQNHLYILVGNSQEQQRAIYQWYLKLHVCEARHDQAVCNKCAPCVQVNHGNYVNNIVVQKEDDKKTIGVEAIADLQRIFMSSAQMDAPRFFCIEEADDLTVQAANSVLKFLEEPQGQTIGFLFIKNEQRLLPTIRSRGQLLRLRDEVDVAQLARIEKKLPAQHLQKSAEFLLSIGYEEKVIIKQTPVLYETILRFLLKLSKGAPPIVAQTDLEESTQKTKTGSMVLELLIYLLNQQLQDEAMLPDAEAGVIDFVRTRGNLVYLAAYQALAHKRFHMGTSMLMTSFSLELCARMRQISPE